MPSNMKRILTKRVTIFTFIVVLIVGIGIVVGLVLLHLKPNAYEVDAAPGFQSRLGVFETAAVATDARECAKVGKDILMKNGSAVDSAIATLLCMGVVIPHSSGIGGGFLMTIYDREKGVSVLDARESAPISATEDMFKDCPLNKSVGGLSVAVPGEVAGMYEAHRKFGKLDWAELFQPAIQLAKDGFRVGSHLARAITQNEKNFIHSPELSKLLKSPKTNSYYQRGEFMKNPKLAKTLEIIAKSGNDSGFYEGDVAKDVVESIQQDGGIITLEDLSSYKARWLTPLVVKFGQNKTMHTFPLPGSGVVLALILNIITGYPDLKDTYERDPGLFYHRLLEAYKFGFAQRTYLEDRDDEEMKQLLRKLTSTRYADTARLKIDDTSTSHDPDFYGASVFYSPDNGTAHVSVVAPNGDAVAASTTVNLYFGSRLVTNDTGILLNDEMDDFNSPNITNAFGVPPSGANHIKPHKRPLSSMAPSVIVDDVGNVRMTVGGSGGTHITTGIASVILRTMWLDEDVKTAIDAPRIHHQLYPNSTIYEKFFSKEILASLTNRSHLVKELTGRGAVIEAIVRGEDGKLYANADYRKEGEVDGF